MGTVGRPRESTDHSDLVCCCKCCCGYMLHVTLSSHEWQTWRLKICCSFCLLLVWWDEKWSYSFLNIFRSTWTTTTSQIMIYTEIQTAPAANCVDGDGCTLFTHTEPISFSVLLHLSFLNAFIWNSLCRPFLSWVHMCLIKPAVVPFRSLKKVRYKPNLYVTASCQHESMAHTCTCSLVTCSDWALCVGSE